ncbi:uroporphyrinogen decarboxylase (URO-D) [Oxobacter pfennigii]|uniref:Uroporphyrinogen decarboxylase (URO-D) n=1 Tax=Oxobacter pfennigii TaxID=36849 RepID=A0A0P8WCU3_9CLOT|nr:uroporphyrinogen decarboxylase family protein [Oxobacter pfennigii]KPU45586.1 uroporphyrinogen decarboxylase (URO-D) [Oxobacter pfennigii]
MAVPKFDEKELKVVGEVPNRFGGPPTPLYDFPVSRKEAYIAALKREPVWQITTIETRMFSPKANPDNVARAFVIEDEMMPPDLGGGKDMFGIEWVYVPVAGGSMVKPGNPFLKNANEWEEKLVWPDLDKWDWKVSEKAINLSPDVYNIPTVLNGWFERLISFMDFDNAVIALIDDEQKDAVKALFDKLSDLYIKLVDKYLEHFPGIDGFNFHDDWGAQKDTFFSPATCNEMIVPAMRKLTDYIHSKGMFADFHCCGQDEKQVPNMIAAGWDSWSGQPMNDTHMLYEKYGDKIILGIIPDPLNPDASEEEQRAAAAKYVEKFCQPGKPSLLGFYAAPMLTPAFREEVYKLSRIRYGGK